MIDPEILAKAIKRYVIERGYIDLSDALDFEVEPGIELEIANGLVEIYGEIRDEERGA